MNSSQAFDWAKSIVDDIASGNRPGNTIKTIDIKNVLSYFQGVGSHDSMYHNNDTNETYFCMFQEKEGVMRWFIVGNYNEMLLETPDLVRMLLKNGEYFYSYVNGVKGQKVVNLSFFDKKKGGSGKPKA